jgi:hypothetical protein
MHLRIELKWIFICIVLLTSIVSCKKSISNNLNEHEIKFIKKLGLLNQDEHIIYFNSQGSFGNKEQSGNFISDQRLASYWIDDHNKDKNTIEFAFYEDIDTIKCIENYRSLTYASYLLVKKKDHREIKIYVDADSSLTWKFFNKAISNWQAQK